MIAIKNATLVMRDHLIPNAVILCEDGKILDFGKNLAVPEGAELIDAEGKYVGPGLVDIHTHSAAPYTFFEEPEKAAKVTLAHGVTTVCPALYFRWDAKGLMEKIAIIMDAVEKGKFPTFGGVYMEAPYMNTKFGDANEKPWSGPIKREDYMDLIRFAGENVKVWVTAPEREHIEDFVIDVLKINPKAIFAVGHSEATPEQIEKLIPYGLKIGTHHTNATGTLEKYPECRTPCVDECVNYNSEIYAELICDSQGIHVDPYNLRLIRKIKGDDRIILISDSGSSASNPKPNPPGYEDVDDLLFEIVGDIVDIAGSKLTLDLACRNFMVHTGASLVDVFRFASYNPSRALGFFDRGEIRRGLRADLVICDHMMKVEKVVLDGRLQNT